MRLALLACLTFASPLQAEQSKAAAWLIKEQLLEACGEAGGEFHTGAVIEDDLTGDGRADLILSHGGVVCTGEKVTSDFCGAMMCSVLLYVREGELLILKREILSAGGDVSLSDGAPPEVRLINHDGSDGLVRWTGSAFE